MKKMIIRDFEVKNTRKENGQLLGILIDLATGKQYHAYFSTSEMRWLVTNEA